MMKIISLAFAIVCLDYFDLVSQILPKTDSIINNKDSTGLYINDYTFSHEQENSITSFGGENDILKFIQFTPGTNSINESTNEMSIHGFAPQNKSVLMDGVEIYYPNHIYNSTSIIQTNIINSTKLFSNNYPANYGGKLFSVIDISIKDGDMQNYHSSAEINPITAKLTFNGPIIKNKLSFILSTRYNYSSVIGDGWNYYKDSYVNDLDKIINFNKIDFFDIYAKFIFNLDDKNQISYWISNSRDNLNSTNEGQINSYNLVNKLQWKHLFNENLYADNSISYSNHTYSNKNGVAYPNPYILSNGICELTLKSDFNFIFANANSLKYGISCVLNEIKPFTLSNADTNTFYNENKPYTKKSVIASIYIVDKHAFGDYITLNYGIRYNAFSTFGKDSLSQYMNGYPISINSIIGSKKYSNWQHISFFQSLEPRINADIKLNENNIFNISYSYSTQYLHNLPVSELYNADIWYASNKYLKPQASNHFSIGYNHQFCNHQFDVGAESYFALIENVNDIKDGGTLLMNSAIETDIAVGSGKSYGLEFFVKRNTGKLSGWISYTLSKSLVRFSEINNNKWYPSSYESLHNLAVVLFYNVNNHWILSSDYTFISGSPTTLPPITFGMDGFYYAQYFERNKYLLPNYTRIDISSTYKFEPITNRWKSEISAGIYNIFNKNNSNRTIFNTAYGYISLSSGEIVPYIKLRVYF